MSVLDADHFMALYDGNPPPLKHSTLDSIRTVSGESMPIRGILQTVIEIAGGQCPCAFKVIEGVEYKGVLGQDFFHAHRAHISFETLTLELKEPAPVTFSNDLVAVVAPTTYVIPPKSEAVLPAKMKGETLPGAIGLIESIPQLAERYQLQEAAALVKISDDQTVPFRLINPTSRPVTLYKGATLGTFSEANKDPDLCPVGGPNMNVPVQETLESVPVDFSNSKLTPEEQTRLRSLLDEYRDIFAVHPEELGRTNLV